MNIYFILLSLIMTALTVLNNTILFNIKMQEKPEHINRVCEICRKPIQINLYNDHCNICGNEQEQSNRHKKDKDSRTSKRSKKDQRNNPEKKMCQLCGQFVLLTKWTDHPRECSNRLQRCQNCHQHFPLTLMVEHTRLCLMYQESENQSENTFNEEESEDQGEDISTISSIQSLQSMQQGMSLNDGQERRIYLLRRLGNIVIELTQYQDDNQELSEHLRAIRMQIQRSARQAGGRRREGMRKEQIDSIPVRLYTNQADQASQNEVCSICLSDFEVGDRIKDIRCGHLFHEGCIQIWLKHNKKCPLCKQNVTAALRKQQQQGNPFQKMIKRWFDPEGNHKKQKQ